MAGRAPQARRDLPATRCDAVILPGVVLVLVCMFFVLQATGLLEQLRRTRAERQARPPAARPPRTLPKPGKELEKRLRVFEDFLENLTDDDPPKGKDPS